MQRYAIILILVLSYLSLSAQGAARQWMTYELSFQSSRSYENPIYDVRSFHAVFTSPSGKERKVNGFWDGGRTFRIRFMPDETGAWRYETFCSDEENPGLHGRTGTFECLENNSDLPIYRRGAITQPKGTYHLAHRDGTPFLWVACTAWNGALKSTEEEWATYLAHRADHRYSVIQFVTTQWRGAEGDSEGRVAYEGAGRIRINPAFFQHMDEKVDKINEHGLVAAPVLLWALPFGKGRHLSPGYTLPLEEAVLLARYTVARYGGHHVIWILGGDGRYAHEYEQRWLEIGRRVFADDPPGLVAQHPHGRLWIGDNHAGEDWLDIVGYQSSHSNAQGTVDWINKGPVASRWPHLPARPVLNMEPNYEEIHNRITAKDVRNASYWSIFATPVSGITYGANGIWPWIREGEKILNHGQPDHVSTWRRSIDFSGSLQIGYLGDFLRRFEWWNLRPANELLVEQPGENRYNQFVSVLKSLDQETILVYIPHPETVRLYAPMGERYEGQWFDPAKNEYSEADLRMMDGKIEATSAGDGDVVLILRKK